MPRRGCRAAAILALSILASATARIPAGDRQKADLPADPDLRLILARLAGYVDSYQQQFSAIVAEESYEQVSMGRRVHLRSDLLLLPPAAGGDWVQFRDVYEVDGQKVRDREDRLKKLFLENNPEGRLQLEAIRKESARYNLGEVQRNQNVPLYPLTFVTAANASRFTFKIAKKGMTGGTITARVEYVERARPTFVRNLRNEDVPVRGSFTVDDATGAVLESEMLAQDSNMRGRVVVRYRRDETQGLWLPNEMHESYEVYLRAASGNLTTPVLRAEGRATYSNFRRFRVSTDTQFKEKK